MRIARAELPPLGSLAVRRSRLQIGLTMATAVAVGGVLTSAANVDPTIERLDNGLTVVLAEDHARPLVSVQLWFTIGSASDPADLPGLCHVTRALLADHQHAALRLRAAGLRHASWTQWDATAFATLLPPNFLGYALAIEAERLQPFELDPAALEAAKAAAVNWTPPEWVPAERGLSPALTMALFGDHPYRLPPDYVGEAMGTATPQNVEECLARHFSAGSATLALYGDFDAASALPRIRELFADARPGAAPRYRFRRLEPLSEPKFVAAEGRPSHVELAWRAAPAGNYENAALLVLAAHLRARRDTEWRQGLTDAGLERVQWDWFPGRDASVLRATIGPRGGHDADLANTREVAARTLSDEFARLAARRLAPVELIRARAMAQLRLINHGEQCGTRARRVGWGQAVLDFPGWHEQLIDLVATVGVDDVRDVAVRLAAEPPVALSIGPSTSTHADTAPRELAAPPLQRLGGGEALRLLAQYAADAPRPALPTSDPEIIARELAPGLKVTVCRQPGRRGVHIATAILMPDIPETQFGLLTPDNIGTRKFSCDELDDYLTLHGMTLNGVSLPYPSVGVSGFCQSEQAPQLIELQADRLHVMELWPQLRLTDLLPSSRIWVVVVGDVKIDDLADHTRQVWADATMDPPDEPATPRPAWRGNFDGGFRVAVADFGQSPWAAIAFQQRGVAEGGFRERLLNAAVIWCNGVGGGCPLQLDGLRGWRWGTNAFRAERIGLFRTPLVGAGFVNAVEQLQARLAAITHGEMTSVEATQALRLARVHHLLNLDVDRQLVRAIIEEGGSPWCVDLDSLQPAALLRELPGMVRDRPLRVILPGGPHWSESEIEQARQRLEPLTQPRDATP